jgi:glycosyltransferase involved in cell wall biosynthesis
MKILQTCLSSSWGGMEMYSLQTARLLIDAGAEVELLCCAGSRLHFEAVKTGLTVNPVRFPIRFNLSVLLSLNRLLNNKQYDLIHAEASKDLWLLVPALKFSGLATPLILTKHVGSFIKKTDILHRWIYNRVDKAIAISEVIKRNLLETTTLREDQILMIHDSIDASRFDPDIVSGERIRSEFNIKDRELLLGINARLSPGKGHEEFLHAAKKLACRYDNLKFLIVGESSKNEADYDVEIKNLAARLDHGSKVIFTGFRADIPEILAAIDIFVFPSHAEAFGLALVEAMSMRKPSVCCNSDGVLDIAVDGNTSLFFERKNADDLTVKLESLIREPALRNILGLNARKRVLENFNTDIFIGKVIDTYERLIYR